MKLVDDGLQNSETPAVSSTIQATTLRERYGSEALVWAIRVAAPITVLIGWQAAGTLSHLVPDVGATARVLVDQISTGAIVDDALSTVSAVLYGFGLAVLVSLPIAFITGRSAYWYEVIDPLLAAMFALPRVILYPVLLSFLGVGANSKVVMAFLGAVFPIAMLATAGIRAVDPVLIRLGRTLELSAVQMFRKVILPAAAPAILSGIRIGFSVSFVAVIVAELFLARDGLGVAIRQAYATLQVERMFALVVFVTVLALAGNLIFWGIEERFHRSYR